MNLNKDTKITIIVEQGEAVEKGSVVGDVTDAWSSL